MLYICHITTKVMLNYYLKQRMHWSGEGLFHYFLDSMWVQSREWQRWTALSCTRKITPSEDFAVEKFSSTTYMKNKLSNCPNSFKSIKLITNANFYGKKLCKVPSLRGLFHGVAVVAVKNAKRKEFKV